MEWLRVDCSVGAGCVKSGRQFWDGGGESLVYDGLGGGNWRQFLQGVLKKHRNSGDAGRY